MDETLEDFDSCEVCGCSLTWMNFKSFCQPCEEKRNSDEWNEACEEQDDYFMSLDE